MDPAIYRPLPGAPLRWDLSYLGTYSADRQPALERLLLEPARRAPERRFVVAGPQYPAAIDWPANVERIEHVPPADHPAFYAASRFTLNVTRADMVRAGHSPSVRLFEAAACGTPILSDTWDGLDAILAPGAEIAPGGDAGGRRAAFSSWPEERRRRVARAARGRVLAGHTAAHRAGELETHLRAAVGAAANRPAPRRHGARAADAQVSY